MAKLWARISALRGGNYALTEAVLFDIWLREFTLRGPFPIPYRLIDLDVIESVVAQPCVLFSWPHLPLCSFSLTVAADFLSELPSVVADPGHIVADNRFLVLGRAETAPALSLEGPVLRGILSRLRAGKPVVCLSDDEFGGRLSDYSMRIAAKTEARVIFGWTERQPDGMLHVHFRWAPHPRCESDAAIAGNMEFLRTARQKVLDSLGWTPPPSVP